MTTENLFLILVIGFVIVGIVIVAVATVQTVRQTAHYPDTMWIVDHRRDWRGTTTEDYARFLRHELPDTLDVDTLTQRGLLSADGRHRITVEMSSSTPWLWEHTLDPADDAPAQRIPVERAIELLTPVTTAATKP